MTEDEIENEKQSSKGKSGKEETGAVGGQKEIAVSPGAAEKMGLLGVSKSMLVTILSEWKHHEGQSLLSKLADFARGGNRASANAEVEIKRDKDFGLVHNYIKFVKDVAQKLAHRQRLDHRNTPGPHGP